MQQDQNFCRFDISKYKSNSARVVESLIAITLLLHLDLIPKRRTTKIGDYCVPSRNV